LQDEEYAEGAELAPQQEADEEADDQQEASSTTTTESSKKIKPSVRPFRSNEDLLSALKKRRLNEKLNKASGNSSNHTNNNNNLAR